MGNNINSLSDKALVRQAMNAAMRAGTANSGLCFDPTAGWQWEEMKEYGAELERRLRAAKQASTVEQENQCPTK